MIRLLVNAGGKKAGAIVDPAELGDGFAQELLAAGQAEEVAPIDAAQPILELVSRTFDQMREVGSAMEEVVARAQELGQDDRIRVANAIVDGLSGDVLAEIQGVEELLDLADRPRMTGFAALDGDAPENTPAGGPEAQPSDATKAADAPASAGETAGSPSTGRDPVKGDEAAAPADPAAASQDNPPPAAEPSGDIAGAAAWATDPSAPPKPTGATAGKGRRKRT